MVLLAPDQLKIIRQPGQQIERSLHGSVLLAEDDLIAAAEDFDFAALESKLFRQADRLTVSGSEYPRGAHSGKPSQRIYVKYIHNLFVSQLGYALARLPLFRGRGV